MAAVWGNYRWTDFTELDGELQSQIVAAYRAQNQIEAVMAKEQTRKARQGRQR